MNRQSFFVMAERPVSTHRHIVIMDGERGRPLCRYTGPDQGWVYVEPDPAAPVPMCAQCLKSATRVADLADRQEGIE